MLFQLPSYIGIIGVTVVILPLVALIADQFKRAQDLGINAAIFDPRNPPDSARLVFTTPETCRSESFLAFLLRLRDLQQLDRIFIDECHVILNQNQSFRKDLGRLNELLNHKTQLIFLTATLPPRYQLEFLGKFFLTPADVRIYRLPTNRTNISYSVLRNMKKQEIFGLIRKKDIYYPNDRLIVYTRNRVMAEEYSKELEWPVYFSNSKQKQRVLKKFLEGSKQRIIATNSLGLGLNPSNIRVVIHIGRPYKLYDYAQESGRAGRNGEKSEAILITPFTLLPPPEQKMSKNEQREVEIIDRYIVNPERLCRRFILSEYLDESIVRCTEKDQNCDICPRIEPGIFYIKNPVNISFS